MFEDLTEIQRQGMEILRRIPRRRTKNYTENCDCKLYYTIGRYRICSKHGNVKIEEGGSLVTVASGIKKERRNASPHEKALSRIRFMLHDRDRLPGLCRKCILARKELSIAPDIVLKAHNSGDDTELYQEIGIYQTSEPITDWVADIESEQDK